MTKRINHNRSVDADPWWWTAIFIVAFVTMGGVALWLFISQIVLPSAL